MAYQVVKSSKAISQFNLLYDQYDRMEELEKAITWFLERTPREKFTYDLKKNNCRLWLTEQLPSNFPRVRIVYQVSDTTHVVTILSIERVVVIDPRLQ